MNERGETKKKKRLNELSPLDVYRLLPGTNCGECGEINCMAYAARLVNGEYSLTDCTPLNDPENSGLKAALLELTAPPVREVTFGKKGMELRVGGKQVLYRHEFTYHDPSPVAIDIADSLSDSEILERIQKIENFCYRYIGRELRPDAIAIRDVSNEKERFTHVARLVLENSCLPCILCTYKTDSMESALEGYEKNRPLLYAATIDNWHEMAVLAQKYSCPLVVSVPHDLNGLKTLSATLQESGLTDLILDPGTSPGEGMAATLSDFTEIRMSVFRDDDPYLGCPLLGTPISVWSGDELSHEALSWQEAWTAPLLMSRYADLIIMHSLEGWALLPVLIWRFNLYTDPRKPVSVEPGVRTYGTPGPRAPVFVTTNYALTFFTVESDIKTALVDCYLLVIDTGGLSVESAVAGRYLNPASIADAIKEFSLAGYVNHTTIIIPGLAARISGDTEEVTGWKVIVGPKDSSGIPMFVRNKWTALQADGFQ